jgi:inner membrane protein
MPSLNTQTERLIAMTGKTHLLIGVGAGLLMVHYAPQPTLASTVGMIAAAALGSLLPDIDSPESTINNWIPPLRLLTLFFKHRGIFHTLYIPLLFALIGIVQPQLQHWMFALSAGYLSHLVADCMTIHGLSVLYPLSIKVHLLPPGFRIQTGGIVERLLLLGLLAGIGYYLYLIGMPLWN